jgi:multiple sugar transport system substrate-binding protein
MRWLLLAVLTGLIALGYGLTLWAQEPVTISFLVRAVEGDQLQTLADDFMAEKPGDSR